MKKTVNILHVVISLEPGGMENGAVNLAKKLGEDFETHFCCLERGGAFVERLARPDRVYILNKANGFHFSAAARLASVIRRIKADVIHTHNLGPLIYAALAKVLAPRALLHGEHGLLPAEQCAGRRLRQRKILYRTCQRIHTVSEGLRRQLIEIGLPGEKIVTILNGVDTDRFSPANRQAARRQLGLPEEGIILGVVGRFGTFKRHSLLIDAFEHLAAQNKNVHLLVVGGGGSEETAIRKRAQASSVANRMYLTGLQNDLPPYYRAMDLLVVPSVNEGLSNVVLEAMACGIPVLANNTCGNDEVILSGEHGIVADLCSEEKLRSEMEKWVAQPGALNTMGQNARNHVSKSFSIAQMVYNYQNLYQEVAREK